MLFYVVFALLALAIRCDIENTGVIRKKLFDHVATKSPYFTHPISTAHHPLRISDENVNAITRGYVPVHVDALYRHGTRYPGKAKVFGWKDTAEKLLSHDSNNQIKSVLEKWNEYFPSKYIYTLHEKGFKEMQKLAAEFKSVTGQLLADVILNHRPQEKKDIHIFASPTSRTVASGDAFITSLHCLLIGKAAGDIKICNQFYPDKYLSQNFNKAITTYDGVTFNINRDQLRAFDYCERYLHTVDRNVTASIEHRRFFQSDEFQDVTERVSRYFPGYDLQSHEVIDLYLLCAFLLVLHDYEYICNYFSESDLEVLEYAADLKHYYRTGYGYPINYQLSCRLLRHVIENLNIAKNNLDQNLKKPSIVLRFGHAETLIPLLCLLGLYKDDKPLTAFSYSEHKTTRLFRTGTFSPFSGNMLFILYKHKENPSAPLKIAVVLNSNYIKLPIAGSENCYLCNLHSVLDYLYAILSSFKCETVCNYTVHNEL